MPTLCLKYDKVHQPVLKVMGSDEKSKFAKIAFQKILSHKNCGWKSNSNNKFEFSMKKYMRSTKYFEAFHTVHACTQSLPFIPTTCTKYVKYIYLSPVASCMF